jgi:isopentenyl-diphosphate delta-isomerase
MLLARFQLDSLCAALGAEGRLPELHHVLAVLMDGWGGRPFEEFQHGSSICIDGSPFELSVAFESRGLAIRGLVAPPAATGYELWQAGLATNARLRTAFGVDIGRFHSLEALFAPSDTSTDPFSIWHAFSLEPDGELLFKVYLNPRSGAAAEASATVRRALASLGFEAAWSLLEKELARDDDALETAFLSIDLLGGDSARVKVYLEHRSAQVEEIERILAYSPDHELGDASRMMGALAGPGERYGRQRPMSCLAFTGHDPALPTSVTLQVPLWAHVKNDEVALARLLTLVPSGYQAGLDQAVRTIGRRDLSAGVGLIPWVSLRRTADDLRCTAYFAAEAYTVWAPRRTAGAIDAVGTLPVRRGRPQPPETQAASTTDNGPSAAIARRKDAHLDLATTAEVEPPDTSTLFDCVSLVHCAMPELSLAGVDTSVEWFGRRLSLPFVITGMTGGTDRAARVNRELAAIAERTGIAFGVGSQRAMSRDPGLVRTYAVRSVAPTTILLGNIGAQQAREIGVAGVRGLMEAIGADAMAIHLNVAQELIQPEGDRDFTDFARTITDLVDGLDGRILVKETGCGISPAVARHLVTLGVRHIDISGSGGTSWVRIEQLRAEPTVAQIGETFTTWGIPTAAATAAVRTSVGPDPTIIASGGIRTGLDAAKALALGADLAGVALPVFRALEAGGPDGAESTVRRLGIELRYAMLMTASTTVGDLRRQPKVLRSPLRDWCDALTPSKPSGELSPE